MDSKPGIKTTEFWMAMATLVVGLGLIVYGAIDSNDDAKTTGVMLMSVATGGYSISRGLAKHNTDKGDQK